MGTYESDEVVIDLRDLVSHLLGKLWIILFTTILVGVIGYGYSKFIVTPKYTSSSQLYVMGKTQSLTDLSLSDLQIGTQLTSDYMILIQSRPVMDEVISNLGLDMDYRGLKNIMEITNPSGTRILKITVDYPDAYIAKEIVDEITSVACARIATIMDLDEPNVFENGYVATEPSSPNVLKNTVIAALIGFVLIIGILVVLYLMDDTIKTPEDVERYLGLSTLGTIPHTNSDRMILNKRKKKKQKVNG